MISRPDAGPAPLLRNRETSWEFLRRHRRFLSRQSRSIRRHGASCIVCAGFARSSLAGLWRRPDDSDVFLLVSICHRCVRRPMAEINEAVSDALAVVEAQGHN